MTLYNWALFAFCSAVVANAFGISQPLGRALLALFWLIMLLVLLFGQHVLR